MTSFHLTITAPDTILCNDPALYCKVITPVGSLGIEAHHEPLLVVLKENSEITYKDESGTKKSLTAESGLLSFMDNKCVITMTLPRTKVSS